MELQEYLNDGALENNMRHNPQSMYVPEEEQKEEGEPQPPI